MNNSELTPQEFVDYIAQYPKKDKLKYKEERAFAILAGWDDQKYKYLYRKFIYSTHNSLGSGKEKGDTLEELARYFLKYGGIVHDIKELKAGSKWQVDGQGIINKSTMTHFWGEEFNSKIGFQIYLECKNHNDPAEKRDFNDHCTRMDDNNCKLGLFASASGFKIAKGQGIAERLYLTTFQNKFNLLFAVVDFDRIIYDNKPPIIVLIEAIDRTTNDKYRICKVTQEQYSKDYCHDLLKKRYDELFNLPAKN